MLFLTTRTSPGYDRGMNEWWDVEALTATLRDAGIWAAFVSIFLNVLISVIGVVPSVFLSGANAVVFGPVNGFFVSLAGEVLGAALSFWLYRLGARRGLRWEEDRFRWQRAFNGLSRKRQVLVLLSARLAPMVPSGAVTFAAAVSGVRFADFLVTSAAGKTPSLLLETMIGHDLVYFSENKGRLALTLVLLLLMAALFWRTRKDEKAQHQEKENAFP